MSQVTKTRRPSQEVLAEDLRQHKEANNISYAAVARSLGISDSALSQWLSGNYQGDVDKITRAVREYLQRVAEREQMPRREMQFISTSVAQQIFETARICHLDGEMGVAYGPSGLGKTWAVREYARENSDVILMEVDDQCALKLPFIRSLHELLGMDGVGRMDQLLRDVVRRLRGSGRLLIIDEAENLPHGTLEMIRRLHDFCLIGVLLVGMPLLIQNLQGRHRDYAQLYSRVTVPCKLKSLRLADTEEIVSSMIPSANGLARVFHELSYGNVRVLRTLITRSIRIAELNDRQVDEAVIRAIREQLITKEN